MAYKNEPLLRRFVLLITAACLCFPLGGCGKKEEAVQETVSINVSQGEDEAFDISSLTMEDVYKMTPEQVESTVTKGVSNWREIFSVDEDHEMTRDDWEAMRKLLGYSLWGSDWLVWYRERETEEMEAQKSSIMTVSENLPDDPDYIYYAPTKKFLQDMTDDEYADYMEKLLEYYNYDTVDFHQLTHEQLEELKDDQINNVAVDDDYYMETVGMDSMDVEEVPESTISVSNDSVSEEIEVKQIEN